MSRRSLLSRAGVAAAGLVVAGALTQRDIREAKATPTTFATDTFGRGAVEGTHTGQLGQGVSGTSNHIGVNGTGDNYGVYGSSPLIGVSGKCEGTTGGIGVEGRHDSRGPGVLGGSVSGTGVEGSSSGGYGGQFGGGRAQLKLVPASAAGRPKGAHSKGEIYMDAAAGLFVCVRGGTPGTWRKVTTTAV